MAFYRYGKLNGNLTEQTFALLRELAKCEFSNAGLENKVIRGQSQKRMARWPKTNNGDEELYWKSTAFNVVLREACVF